MTSGPDHEEEQGKDALPHANWYPDPAGGGGQRYWGGTAWTDHVVPPPPPYATPGVLPWKGAKIGRPAEGPPGALAEPGRRLAAQVIDWLLLIPVFGIILTITLLIAAPHFGPIFPQYASTQSSTTEPMPGFIWIYVTIFACALATGLIMVAYQTVTTAKFGRSFGKRWLHIRPVRVDLSPLGWGRSFGRAAIYGLFNILSGIGLLDPLWCLWDEDRQCIHDKAVDSIVINDLASVE